ncbi:MAG: NADH-quinone oxidoreductase subunit J [Calditrichaeota bacterium]|nr:MAG: NADH-quinone oxidoreductase subunit J [Calditrichota bacterium]
MLLNKNPVYSVLLLIVTLFAIAGLYVLLNASFIAAVHMIVYAGAIMVLFLFVIMLLDLREDVEHINLKRFSRIVALIAAAIFLGEVFLLMGMTLKGKGITVGLGQGISGDVPSVAELLFTKYLLPFEVASVLLLVAIIGAVILAKRKLKPRETISS